MVESYRGEYDIVLVLERGLGVGVCGCRANAEG